MARQLHPATARGWQVRLKSFRALRGFGARNLAPHVAELVGAIEHVASVPDKPLKHREAYEKELVAALKAAGDAVAPFIDGLIERTFRPIPKVGGVPIPKAGNLDAKAFRKALDARLSAHRAARATSSLAMRALTECASHASEDHAAAIAAKIADPPSEDHPSEDHRWRALHLFEGGFRRFAKLHLSPLLGALSDKDSSIRQSACFLVGDLMNCTYSDPVIVDAETRIR